MSTTVRLGSSNPDRATRIERLGSSDSEVQLKASSPTGWAEGRSTTGRGGLAAPASALQRLQVRRSKPVHNSTIILLLPPGYRERDLVQTAPAPCIAPGLYFLDLYLICSSQSTQQTDCVGSGVQGFSSVESAEIRSCNKSSSPLHCWAMSSLWSWSLVWKGPT